ncbi:hypothetical protein HOLleu_29546 [Holothuria leucospilota]|uniref:Uncharacterized protein n=1 Tax=Holothuria leucospilota TaxID=206669 RepID=A0A9Q1H2P9_HOLLE|nr:hypothetical protein HOLleu_29546 [Holothuria leucospilota]
MGFPEVKKQHFSRIPKIIIGQKAKFPKNSQDRSYGVTRGQKAKYPKCSQDHHLGSPEVKKQISQRNTTGVMSIHVLIFLFFIHAIFPSICPGRPIMTELAKFVGVFHYSTFIEVILPVQIQHTILSSFVHYYL